MYRFEKIAPLTGPTVAGPLGVAHLPRMWLKGVLSAAGLLMPEYYDDYKGFNKRVCDGLGLAPEPWFAFLATMPTYPQAEDYVREHAARLDTASIAALNDELLSVERPEDSAAAVRARVGLTNSTLRSSARLINIDDWFTLHEQLLAHRGSAIEPLVPMVSSSEAGPLGIAHLPRLWMKSFESAMGALPAEWKTGINCGFDCFVATLIGLDIEAATTFIHTTLPTYLAFEAWVDERIGRPDDATKAKWTSEIRAREKNPEQAASDVAEAEAPGVTSRVAALLNDLVDWKHMHAFAVARASGAGLATA
jgi:hypothetical protein